MAYGLRIKDAAGNVLVNYTDTLTRLRWSYVSPASEAGSIVLSDIDGLSSVEFGIALDGNKCGHTVIRSGTTISWSPNSFGAIGSSDTLICVFLYT